MGSVRSVGSSDSRNSRSSQPNVSPVSIVNYIQNLGRGIHEPLKFEETFIPGENKFCVELFMKYDGIMYNAKGKGITKKEAKNNAAFSVIKLIDLPNAVIREIKNIISPHKKSKKTSSKAGSISSADYENSAIDDLHKLCDKMKYSKPVFDVHIAEGGLWVVRCAVKRVKTDNEFVSEVGEAHTKQLAKHIAAELVIKSLTPVARKARNEFDEEDASSGQSFEDLRGRKESSEEILKNNYGKSVAVVRGSLKVSSTKADVSELESVEEEAGVMKTCCEQYVMKPRPGEIPAFDSFDASFVNPEELEEIISELKKKHEFIRHIQYKRNSVNENELYRCLLQVTSNPPKFFVGTAATEQEARVKSDTQFIQHLKQKTFTYNNYSMFMY